MKNSNETKTNTNTNRDANGAKPQDKNNKTEHKTEQTKNRPTPSQTK